MDSRFLPAVVAIHDGDVEQLERLLEAEPALATDRSSCSHPTLMQCLVLDAVEQPADAQRAMARLLLNYGSTIDEPLIACGSLGNVVLGELLLDAGAALDGRPDLFGGWSVLEESLYWGFPDMTDMLLARGAAIHNLRIAAGIGSCDEIERFFAADGSLLDGAGPINFPFGDKHPEQRSSEPQDVLDNALSYAALGGHDRALKLLLERGAAVNSHPLGFHYRGTALHQAAIRGHRATCDLLLQFGADPKLDDLTVPSKPADWARHGGHEELAQHLDPNLESGARHG